MTRRLVATLALGLALSACTTHIAPYRAKRRSFAADRYPARPTPTSGSLFAGDGWFEDDTARHVGDVLVVRIDERDAASRDAATKLAKDDKASYGMPAAVGILAALTAKYPDVDPAQLFATESEMGFAGSGQIVRRGTLSATLPVRVVEELGNGDLYVEGTKVVMVGAEEHHLYLSGIVRVADISADNTVASSRIADAEIEYTGRGDVTDQQRRGWGSRLLGRIWPW